MKRLIESFILIFIAWLVVMAADAYENKDLYCPVEIRNDTSRLMRVIGYVLVFPGMSIGCYLAEEGD